MTEVQATVQASFIDGSLEGDFRSRFSLDLGDTLTQIGSTQASTVNPLTPVTASSSSNMGVIIGAVVGGVGGLLLLVLLLCCCCRRHAQNDPERSKDWRSVLRASVTRRPPSFSRAPMLNTAASPVVGGSTKHTPGAAWPVDSDDPARRVSSQSGNGGGGGGLLEVVESHTDGHDSGSTSHLLPVMVLGEHGGTSDADNRHNSVSTTFANLGESSSTTLPRGKGFARGGNKLQSFSERENTSAVVNNPLFSNDELVRAGSQWGFLFYFLEIFSFVCNAIGSFVMRRQKRRKRRRRVRRRRKWWCKRPSARLLSGRAKKNGPGKRQGQQPKRSRPLPSMRRRRRPRPRRRRLWQPPPPPRQQTSALKKTASVQQKRGFVWWLFLFVHLVVVFCGGFCFSFFFTTRQTAQHNKTI
jgi:hypothetical protein